MATLNPYRKVSCFDAFRRMRHSGPMKVCALSGQKIEIPNRVFSTRNGLHYDIYKLAISILESDHPFFPENFDQEEEEKFYRYFNLKERQFKMIWENANSEFERRAHPEVLYVEHKTIKANFRKEMFAACISSSHRSKLNQYFFRPISRFKG